MLNYAVLLFLLITSWLNYLKTKVFMKIHNKRHIIVAASLIMMTSDIHAMCCFKRQQLVEETEDTASTQPYNPEEEIRSLRQQVASFQVQLNEEQIAQDVMSRMLIINNSTGRPQYLSYVIAPLEMTDEDIEIYLASCARPRIAPIDVMLIVMSKSLANAKARWILRFYDKKDGGRLISAHELKHSSCSRFLQLANIG